MGSGKPLSKPLPYKGRGFEFSPSRVGGGRGKWEGG